MMRRLLLSVSALCLFSSSAFAEELKGRVETNIRAGTERSIVMTEFWVPFAQNKDGVFYADVRLMGDDQNNREGNLGLGYRQIASLPFFDKPGVIGIHGWLDRRITERNSKFNQITLGTEWLGDSIDIRLNGYVPLSDKREISIPNANPQAPELAGTGIVVDTNGTVLEEPQHGLDLEFGFELGQYSDFVAAHTDSFRLYGGSYYFNGDNTEDVAGWRTRLSVDVTEDFQIGARFQRDDERGSQGFLEATVRFPFGSKTSYRTQGLHARLDESPERDIDIVTGSAIDPGSRIPVLNKTTGTPQEVLIVDNTAAAGGDGSAESPFNTLAAAEEAASAQSIIYVRRGNGTSAGQNQGITLNKQGQQLIGSGTNFLYDSGQFTTANGATPTSVVIAPAGDAPVIGNVNALGDGVTISADNVTVAGVTVDNANTGRDGIVVKADGAAASAQNITIENVTAQNNRMGIYLHGTNSGAVSAKVQGAITTANSQHGIAVYDDTDGTFEADLGGGAMGSAGNNVLAGNTLEDLAVEYDGRTLAAQNNWWGQATGPDTDSPDIGIDPQIYYGAPINDGLVGHWTFDTEWTTNTTAYDRSAESNDGTLQGGLSLTDMVDGQNRQALDFDGTDDFIRVAQDNSLNLTTDLTFFVSIAPDNTLSHLLSHNNLGVDRTGGYEFRRTGVSILFDSNNRSGVSTSATIPNGIWSDISVVNNAGASIDFYEDGEFLVNRSPSPVLSPVLDEVLIGRRGFDASSIFDGLMDNMRIYSRPLDPSEIAELYRMDTTSVIDTSGFKTSAP